ncbi:MAG: SDR family NAD(P)-dependent oxidoreductase [Candidatus Promineifilaceae bacterium]
MLDKKIPPKRALDPRPRAIIIGASSGIGAALARRLAFSGYLVAAVARRQEQLEELCRTASANLPDQEAPVILPYVHDVNEYDEIPQLFQTIVQDLGGLDLIVYAAAAQVPVEGQEYDFEKDRLMLDTNLLGAVAWLDEAASRFSRARRGHIVGISSIAGERGRVAGPAYGASKAALNTYLESLRNRLSRRGVTVTTVIPGFVDTRLLKNASKTFWVISPEEAALQIHNAVQQRKQIIYVPKRWSFVGLIVRNIPSSIFRRLSF